MSPTRSFPCGHILANSILTVGEVANPPGPSIFEVALHRPVLLPFGMGMSLGDAKSVCDVLTETRYFHKKSAI